MSASFDYQEIIGYIDDEGKNLSREKAFAVFGFAKAMYLAHRITVEEYADILKRLPIEIEEFEAITM